MLGDRCSRYERLSSTEGRDAGAGQGQGSPEEGQEWSLTPGAGGVCRVGLQKVKGQHVGGGAPEIRPK